MNDYEAESDYEQPITVRNKAIELDPNLVEAYYNRGFAYEEQGEKSEAIADFEKLITLTDNPQWIEWARQQNEKLTK